MDPHNTICTSFFLFFFLCLYIFHMYMYIVYAVIVLIYACAVEGTAAAVAPPRGVDLRTVRSAYNDRANQ